MIKWYIFGIYICFFGSIYAQKDTNEIRLNAATVEAMNARNAIGRLGDVHGTFIMAGKKTEVISIANANMDFTSKNARQIFAKVPGIFVYDMDGSGNQINISSRGLDPHRGWEFNLRKDGVLTNSDMYGYPASHYSMPMESIERIEIVRGSGSLQYGAQFGGMINYVSKKADSSRKFQLENYSTVGSYQLASQYTAIGGTVGKMSYYAYISRRSNNGYRKSEHSDYDAESLHLEYQPNSKLRLSLEWSRSNYVYRIPGPLTDSMFAADPTQSTRSRNYFNPAMNVPSFRIFWNPSVHTQVQFTSSAVIGLRSSVQFDKPVTVVDSIVTATLNYNPRQVDQDHFRSFTQEFRLLQHYKVLGFSSVIAAGAQLMNNDLHRTQLGVGTTGSDFNLKLSSPVWGRDMHFKTNNLALYVENRISINPKLGFNFGARVESGTSRMSGEIVYYPSNQIPVKIDHHFPLFGAGFNYHVDAKTEIYGSWSQAYRPMIFKDLVPGSLYEKIDPKIRDANGANYELGFRGNKGKLQWDISAFALQYNHRYGTLAQTDSSGNLLLYRTNIGNSLNKGLEVFVQSSWLLGRKSGITIFTSTSFMNARYTSGQVKSGTENVSIVGNFVESVPQIISRNGFTYRIMRWSITALYSYTASSFADALNTRIPPATGVVGLVPAYGICDFNASFVASGNWEIRAGLNNAFNSQYFTKRPQFYPGPGVWPGNGRNWKFSVIVHL